MTRTGRGGFLAGVALFALAMPGAALSQHLTVSAQHPKPPSGREQPKPVPQIADRDHDKVFDDLELRIAKSDRTTKHRVIITLKGPVTDAGVSALQSAVGRFAVSRKLPIITALAATTTKGQIRALAQQGQVASVALDGIAHAFNENQQATFGVMKARIDAPALDGNADGDPSGYSPGDEVAAVIDTGIDSSHLQLAGGKVLQFVDFTVGGVVRPPYDDNGHGTHVAATIAGSGGGFPREEGVAPNAALVGVKVLDATGAGFDSWVIAGINWAVENKNALGIDVMNLSLGETGCSNGTDPVSQAANAAVAAGIVVVVAAGNDGPAACTIGAPAAAANVITVGAMGDVIGDPNASPYTTPLNVAWFSSRGPTLDSRVKPDLVAPGTHVVSAAANSGGNGYVDDSGTSMASPFVAGTALLMLDANPAWSPATVKSFLMNTANDYGPAGPDNDYGAGRLNAYAALVATGAPISTPPPLPTEQFTTGSLGFPGDARDFFVNVTQQNTFVAANLIMPTWSPQSSSPDFDLFLYSPTGTLLASSEFTIRQEDVGMIVPAVGTFRIRVLSFDGSGPFNLDLQTVHVDAIQSTGSASFSGVAEIGRTVTVSSLGTWNNGWPTPSLTPSWNHCDDTGLNCQIIFGTLGADVYTITPSASATPPFNLSQPRVTGAIEVGDTMAADPGTWRSTDGSLLLRVDAHNFIDVGLATSNSSPITNPLAFGYQWKQCAPFPPDQCANVPAAIDPTYRLASSDEGKAMRVHLTATNRTGATEMDSLISPVIQPVRRSTPRPDIPPGPAPGPRPDPAPDPVPPPAPAPRPRTPTPDLAITMTSNPPPGPIFGVTDITYTIDITNQSDVFGSNVKLADVLPANLSLVSATVQPPSGGGPPHLTCPTPTGQAVTCIGDLAGHSTVRIVLVTHVVSAVFTSNTASVSCLQPDANPVNNMATVIHS